MEEMGNNRTNLWDDTGGAQWLYDSKRYTVTWVLEERLHLYISTSLHAIIEGTQLVVIYWQHYFLIEPN